MHAPIDGGTFPNAKTQRGENILDLCFGNNMHLIVNTEVQDTNMSDHNLVIIDTSLECKDMDTHSK